MKHQATHTLFFSKELPRELRLNSDLGCYIYVESQYNQEANSVITENIEEFQKTLKRFFYYPQVAQKVLQKEIIEYNVPTLDYQSKEDIATPLLFSHLYAPYLLNHRDIILQPGLMWHAYKEELNADEKELRNFLIELAQKKRDSYRAIKKHFSTLESFVQPDFEILDNCFNKEDECNVILKDLYLKLKDAKKAKDRTLVASLKAEIKKVEYDC